MQKIITSIRGELKQLHYPTRERVVKSTIISISAAFIISAIVTLDTHGVMFIVEQIMNHI